MTLPSRHRLSTITPTPGTGSHQHSLFPYRLQSQLLHYPPLACRWQETAENEDFTALANSQGSLDGRQMLKKPF